MANGFQPTEEDIRKATRLVRYEIFMLRAMASEMTGAQRVHGAAYNAVVESFVTHLRLLHNFFWGERGKDDVIAADFMPAGVRWEVVRPPRPDNIQKAYARAHKDVAHVTYDRLKRISGAQRKPWDVQGLMQSMSIVIDAFMRNARQDLDLDRDLRVFLRFAEGSRMGTMSPEDGQPRLAATMPTGMSDTSGPVTSVTVLGGNLSPSEYYYGQQVAYDGSVDDPETE